MPSPGVDRRSFLQRSGSMVAAGGILAGSSGMQDRQRPIRTATRQSEEGVIRHEDVRRSEMMAGFPPAENRRVTAENWSEQTATIRFAQLNPEYVFRTVLVDRGDGDTWLLPRRMIDPKVLDQAQILWGATRDAAREISVAEWLRRSETDAFLILHDGHIVAEQYFGDMGPHTRHILWCGSKAILATVLARFFLDGTLDEQALATKYVPELARTGFRGATLRQLLDQTTAVRCREWVERDLAKLGAQQQRKWVYGTPEFRRARHDYARSSRALGMFPRLRHEPTSGYYDLLLGLVVQEDRQHGQSFEYRDVNPMALQLILERATGTPYIDHLRNFWRNLGAEDGALMMLDPIGTAVGCYSPAITLRDWARWGQMVCNRGLGGNDYVFPGVAELVNDMWRDPGPERLKGKWTTPMPNVGYRSQFWTCSAKQDRKPLAQAAGWCLQKCLIDFERRNVVLQLASFWDRDPGKILNKETPAHGDLAIWSFMEEALPGLIG